MPLAFLQLLLRLRQPPPGLRRRPARARGTAARRHAPPRQGLRDEPPRAVRAALLLLLRQRLPRGLMLLFLGKRRSRSKHRTPHIAPECHQTRGERLTLPCKDPRCSRAAQRCWAPRAFTPSSVVCRTPERWSLKASASCLKLKALPAFTVWQVSPTGAVTRERVRMV